MFKISVSVTEMNDDESPREGAKFYYIDSLQTDSLFYSQLPTHAIKSIILDLVDDLLPLIESHLAKGKRYK